MRKIKLVNTMLAIIGMRVEAMAIMKVVRYNRPSGVLVRNFCINRK